MVHRSSLILLILLLTAAPTLAQEGDSSEQPANGVIRGEVVNGTADGVVPSGGDVMLHIWDGAFQEKRMEHGELAAGGAFRFEEVPFVPGWQYAVMLSYQDVTYFSEAVTVAAGQEELVVTLPIYEMTTTTDAVRVSRQHIFFDAAAADRLLVGEIYVLSNSGDRTVAAPAREDPADAPLAFPLPEGAQDISLENNTNGRFQLTESGFVDTAPLRPGPGGTQVVVRYSLPYEGPISYTFSAPWPVDALTVLTPLASGLEIEGEGLTLQETREMDSGGEVVIFSHGALAADETLALHLSGELVAPPLPLAPDVVSPLSTNTTARSVLPAALLLLGLTLIALAVWLYRRQDSDRQPPVRSFAPPESFEALVTEIALLDEAHEAGRLDESEYARRRLFLFARAHQRMPDA